MWAEAVEWLLQYGPVEIQRLLLDASEIATDTTFPELKPSHYTSDGKPYYDISALAKTLGITEEQTREILRRKEQGQDAEQASTVDKNSIVH